jgi:signal transduction histidine kinase
MSRFYWRLFLAFLAVILITTVISAAIGRVWLDSAVDSTRTESLRGTLGALADQAERVLMREGEDGLRRWLEAQQRLLAAPIFIVTPAGDELLGRRLPPGVAGVLQNRDDARAGDFSDGPRRGRGMRRFRGADDAIYRILIPRMRPPIGRFQEPALRRVYVLVLLLVGALACLALARYLMRPVRALRRAGQTIAGGDLSARAGSEMRARGDEFGALARDFDQMADRVEQVLENQQRLLRDVSHELRSPLTRLQIAAGLLRQKTVGGELAHVDRIDQEVRNLDDLIGQILKFARLDSLKQIDTEPVDMAELLAGIVADARFEGQAMDCDVRLEGDGTPQVAGDASLLASALENVIRNGIQHATSEVRVTFAPLDSGQLLVEISDDGSGVPEDQLVQIFEPFHAGVDGGAGIGLAIASRAIALHGGEIHASRNARGGLRVSIRLPLL